MVETASNQLAALIPVITSAGLAAAFTADSTGIAGKITHIALGDVGRVPSKNETKLKNERLRIPVADGERIDDFQIHLTGLADTGPAFWVREVGFILEDGTLFALWSDTNPLAYKSEGGAVPLLLAFDLVLSAIPAGAITVVGTGANLSLGAWAESFMAVSASTIDNMSRHLALQFEVQDLKKQLQEG